VWVIGQLGRNRPKRFAEVHAPLNALRDRMIEELDHRAEMSILAQLGCCAPTRPMVERWVPGSADED
jgi:hypothetical protein